MCMKFRKITKLLPLFLLGAPLQPALAFDPAGVAIAESPDRLQPLRQPALRLGSGVKMLADITYSQPDGFRPLLLDLYLPGGRKPRPLVLFVHGGSWTTGSKRRTGSYADFPAVLAGVASCGFAVASVDYRLSGEAPFPAALDDIGSALRFLRANAEEYRIDPERIFLWGASAGAHLAALAALSGESADSVRVQGFVGWYGPYDLNALFPRAASNGTADAELSEAETTGAFTFFGCTRQGCPPAILNQASPINHADPGDPPALLIHGDIDVTVPPQQSEALHQRLTAAGVKSELLRIDGAGHSWKGIDPDDTRSASRTALAATLAWLEQQLE